jgi:murein DD-endopeptidase MepM/ murein hydrolase activator NlpD
MKILGQRFRKVLLPAIATIAAVSIPIKTGTEQQILPKAPAVYYVPGTNCISPQDLNGLKVVTDTNFVGGVSHRFDDESIQKLKARIQKPDSLLEYKAPIENSKNIYLEPFGYFFANRPGSGKPRPHMGLDIFVSPNSRKPRNPVLIQAPVDGVIISHKRAREKDNVISNSVTLLGRDGRRYGFDHMARPEDYKDSIPMPTVGTIIKAGDPIGYVGRTGETTMWHLHLTVMTDEQLEKQQNSRYWRTIAEQSGYSQLKGQVNPLNPEDAGPLAYSLSEYRGGKLNLIGDFRLK